MSPSRAAAAGIIAGVLSTAAGLRAMDVALDLKSIDAAIAVGQSRFERECAQFHEPYRIIINKAPLDYVDVVTPFRRVVLAAEARTRVGDRIFGQRHALELLDAAPAQVDIWAELTFHPLNNYVGVPDYLVVLRDSRGAAILPRTFERIPRFGARVDGMPLPLPVPVPGGAVRSRRSEPLLGGTVVAQFDARALDHAGAYDVTLEEAGRELARARVEFGKLR